MHRTSHLWLIAFTTGAVALNLAAPQAQAQSAAGISGNRRAACANANLVAKPASAFPATPEGRQQFNAQAALLENAVACLVNSARVAQRLSALPTAVQLRAAAAVHAGDSVRLRWWGSSDPHTNPQTLKGPAQRVQDAGYTRPCTGWAVYENVYTGWGNAYVTPQAAVNWWMGSSGHRNNILRPSVREMGIAARWGSANTDAGSAIPAVTYVHVFGRCDRAYRRDGGVPRVVTTSDAAGPSPARASDKPAEVGGYRS